LLIVDCRLPPIEDQKSKIKNSGGLKALVSGQNVTADARLTLDLKLEAGEVSETVRLLLPAARP
jgi:hypothetical protein